MNRAARSPLARGIRFPSLGLCKSSHCDLTPQLYLASFSRVDITTSDVIRLLSRHPKDLMYPRPNFRGYTNFARPLTEFVIEPITAHAALTPFGSDSIDISKAY
jgi:hypothetical protein